MYQALVLKLPEYFSNTSYPTHHYHPFHFEIPLPDVKTTMQFYPRTICDWNSSSIGTIESESLEQTLTCNCITNLNISVLYCIFSKIIIIISGSAAIKL